MQTSTEGILAAAIGMKERHDTTEVLQHLKVPVLFIAGMKDTRIPIQRTGEMVQLPNHAEALILKDVGHMGFIEEPQKTMLVIRDFAVRCYL